MKFYAVCELKNGEFECIEVQRKNIALKYRATVDYTIEQLKNDNEIRKEQYKITKFVDLVEHGNGYSPHDHIEWCEKRCEEARLTTYPIFDFQHPENGIEY